MLRFLARELREKCGEISRRYMSNATEIVIGGGLEKPQGGFKEEEYFYKQNNDLITKIRQKGGNSKLKHFISDWNQFEKVLEARDCRTALRETCSLNKHKDCLEEAFFLNEQSDCYTKLSKEDKFTKADRGQK